MLPSKSYDRRIRKRIIIHDKMLLRVSWIILWCLLISDPTLAQCPWQRTIPALQPACICAQNLAKELSVQCDQVDFQSLIKALDNYSKNIPLDLLYINNSTIGKLENNVFANLKIHNIQLSGCKIKYIAPDAFKGQENTMKNLNLQDNELLEVPVDSLQGLINLSLLDLSKNRITKIADNSFSTLRKLTTLKLSDNNITLSNSSLKGLENSLKNLNLKGTKQKRIPDCIKGLKTLAFLDLSQNSLRELPGPGGSKIFEGLESLTALNLERNIIQSIGDATFMAVHKTLSSLSLLNNLLSDFPTAALSALSELRVLDIGFNLITTLPENAFHKNPSITLLAIDGNPLKEIPIKAIVHLNNTLRGLSLGGRFLHCDCKIRWVTEWIRNGDLQVTSRERNPQFCGSPPQFRDRGFYSIKPDEFVCSEETSSVGVATVVNEESEIENIAKLETTTKSTTTTIRTTKITTTKEPSTISTSSSTSMPSTTKATTKSLNPNIHIKSTVAPWKQNAATSNSHQRPPLILAFPPQRNKIDDSNEVIVKSAYRQDNSVIITWESDTANILGFRVVYRLFGDKSFKQGPPLEASEREFKIKNVPAQECIVVCVISLEEINVSPDTVPYSQCREVRTVSSATSNMDKITIAASAAICGTILLAVIVFVAASRRRSRKMHNLQQQLSGKSGLPIGGLPVNCCTGIGTTPSPGGPLSSLATLSAFNKHQDWDQVSAYSGRSIPRPKIYPMDGGPEMMPDDFRSHFSSNGGAKIGKARSIADGQSQHSFSNHSGRYLATNAFPTNLINSRTDLRQSRQSLAGASDRMSRMSFPGSHAHVTPSVASSRRTRPRSHSRDHSALHSGRPGSRYSIGGSTHTLNYCGDTSDNWTDHDMDIYMAGNPTTRGGLVPL